MYPFFIANTAPEHSSYFSTVATCKTSQLPNVVRLSPNVA